MPITPPRPPHATISSAQSVGYGALTVQDPYTLPPSDQARYEQLFTEYARDDGYCYGKEAVDLFGKSGLPPAQLGAIWSMVDNPVDNRLDKLEFALAMHLIVCVSKKNLPLPPALPFALKQLKSQVPPPQAGGMSSYSQISEQNQGPGDAAGMNVAMSSMGGGDFNSGSIVGGPNSSGMPSPRGMVEGGGASSISGGMGMSGLPGPPPLQPAPSSGLSISDAFEGLVGGGDTETVSTYRASTPPVQISNSFDTNNSGYHAPKPSIHRVPSPVPEPIAVSNASASLPSPTRQRNNHRAGDSFDGNEELRAALQKLQAENISLKARLGTMNGEEDDVRKELVKTVTEITRLSTELTTLRAQVLSAKSRLLEVTGELTAAKERKR